MRVFEDQEFAKSPHFAERSPGAVYADLECRGCYFEGLALSLTPDPGLRSTVRNIRFIKCSQRGCSVGSPIVEDVIVDGLKTNGQALPVSGAVFNRVVLRGKIDQMLISNDVVPSILLDEGERNRRIRAFQDANTAYYRHVDWALDISQGEFKDLDIRGVPAHLIVRDPETQAVVTREKALEGRWRELEYNTGVFQIAIYSLLQTDDPSTVLIAPKRHRKLPDYLEDLQMLRDAGVAEPD
jgi:hypothetical protein